MHDAFRLFAPLSEVFRKLFMDALPAKGLAALFAVLVDYLFPGQGARDLAVSAGVLICLDTFTGMWASIVTGKKISSARFSRVLTKLMGYGAVVAVCAAASHALPGAEGIQPVATSSVLGFVVLTEGISILENVKRMGVKTPLFFKKWLDRGIEEAEKGGS